MGGAVAKTMSKMKHKRGRASIKGGSEPVDEESRYHLVLAGGPLTAATMANRYVVLCLAQGRCWSCKY
jgi:hypothetical protein